MSHVDDGALHAYLDGALDELPSARADSIRRHLEACARCAARLEVERRVRQDARRILSLAVPEVEPPSFEELRAYAAADVVEPKTSSSRLYRLGWAASVLLAIGVGWLVRDGQLDRFPTEGGVAASDVSGAAGDEPALAPGVPRVVEDVASPPTLRDAEAVSSAVIRVAGADAGAPDAIETARRGGITSEVGPGELGRDAPNATSDDGPSGSSMPTERRVPTAVATRRTIAVPTVDALTRPVVLGATAEPRDDAPASSDRMLVTTLMDVGATGRPSVPTPEEDVELPEEAPMLVPGVELVSIENLVEGTSPRGVHVVQRLRGGLTLDVYHLPDDPALSEVPRLPAGHEEVRGRRGAGWVIMRADLDRATLLELLARLNTPG
jgi:hypothetical protein